MHYKTIVLELLKQQPEMYGELIRSNSLISTLNQLASQLRESHLTILDQLTQKEPNQSQLLLKSEAMEIAVSQLQESLQTIPQSESAGALSLEGAMAYIKQHTPHG